MHKVQHKVYIMYSPFFNYNRYIPQSNSLVIHSLNDFSFFTPFHFIHRTTLESPELIRKPPYRKQPSATHIKMSINFVPTTQMRHLRACMVCSIVQTQTVRLSFPTSLPKPANNSSHFFFRDSSVKAAPTVKTFSTSQATQIRYQSAHPKSSRV